MKSCSVLSGMFLLLAFQSCSFDSYNLAEQLAMEEDGQEMAIVESEDEMVFDLGKVGTGNEHTILRSDTIYEDVPKTSLVEKEITYEKERSPASADSVESFDLYVVKEHDTAMKIAFYLYKDIRKWREIKELNGTTNLFTGQTIKVPKIPETLNYARPEGNPYLIRKDDTLGRISQQFYRGNSKYWVNIWDNNKEIIDDYDLIFPGFTLYYKDYEVVKKEYREVRAKYDFSNPKRRNISSTKN
ncbi:LysM peptidoglycan-binding domain-containing protein [Halobacteriovorax sp. GFR7]|uniref:LysM peptidoglycan-binding domain-containing protein n=1 Tax=unclassified Halobacteriovorax TaxID=2639665 RepID=UPI003D972F16